MKLMIDCRAVAKLLSKSHEEAPPLATRACLRLHLMTCRACRNVDGQMRFVRMAMHAVRENSPSDLPTADPNR